MDTPQIYIACLAAYNNGILHGEWIDATQDVSTIYNEIHEMLLTAPLRTQKSLRSMILKGLVVHKLASMTASMMLLSLPSSL